MTSTTLCTSTCRKWKRLAMDQNNDRSSFQRFLSEFCEKLKERSEGDSVVPIRYNNSRVTPEELEGECLEWCLQFLSTRKCPVVLAAALAHETYLRVSSCNLQETLKEYTSEKDGSCLDSVDSNKDGDNVDGEDEKVQEYSAEHLHKFVLATLEAVCKQWAEDVPQIPLPDRLLEMSFQAIKNTRRKMEDSHTFIHDFNTLFGLKDQPQQSFYAVFDGHAGTDAAIFASKHLHCLLAHKCGLESDPGEALKLAFKLTDEAFIKKAKREKWRSGTTGVAALVRGNKLHLAWLGDSQAVLVRDGQVATSMEPHKPDRQDERDRIEAQGGFVMLMGDLWRVGGNIAVSRAIGDVNYKPFICSDAEVISLDLDGSEDYLVLACDGAWDCIMPEDIPRLIFNHLIETNFDRSTVANMLVQHAKNDGSTDNISVIVVYFREDISEPKAVNLFNFGGFSQGADDSEESDKGDNKKFRDSKGGHSGYDTHDRADDSDRMDKNGVSDNMKDFEDELPEKLNFDNYFYKLKGPLHSQVDLDYYGILDSRFAEVPKDPSQYGIHNSSELLKNIAESMHSKAYDLSPKYQPTVRDYKDETSPRYYGDESVRKNYYVPSMPKPKAVLSNTQKPAKRVKQEGMDMKRDNKRGLATSPICWAFTGKNKASVQNHRLMNQAAKSNVRGSLNLSELKSNSMATIERNPRLTQSWQSNPVFGSPSKENVINAAGNCFLSQAKYNESICVPNSNRNTLTTSIGQPSLAIFGSQTNAQVGSKKFFPTWRPRRPLKPIAAAVYDAPPTPFMNTKL